MLVGDIYFVKTLHIWLIIYDFDKIKKWKQNKTKLCYITTSNVIKKERRSRGASSEVPSNNASLQSSAVCQEKVMFPNQKPKPNLKLLSRAEKISTSIHR